MLRDYTAWWRYMIASPGRHFGHIDRDYVFFISAGQIIWIMTRLTRSWSHWGREKIDTRYAFELSDRQMSMFGVAFILHICQKSLLVLGSKRPLDLRINIHSHVPLPKWSQLPDKITDLGWNLNHTRHRSNFGIVFGQLLPHNLHSEVQVIFPMSLFLS